ncbi:MAG: hypothetical protein AAGI23_03660 [Bacteroidota bacterium]
MKTLFNLSILALTLCLVQCTQDQFTNDFDSMVSTHQAPNENSLRHALGNGQVMAKVTPSAFNEIESRGTTSLYSDQGQVNAEDWFILTMDKNFMTDTCQFTITLEKIDGQSGIYMYAYDGIEMRFIRGSFDAENMTETTFADLSDMQPQDTLLVFAVYGHTAAQFNIDITMECESAAPIDANPIRDKAIAEAIASILIQEARALHNRLEYNKSYTNFLIKGGNNSSGASFSDGSNLVLISGTKTKKEETSNSNYMSTTYRTRISKLEMDFSLYSKATCSFSKTISYYQYYRKRSSIVYSTGRSASSWKADLTIKSDALKVIFTDLSTGETFVDEFNIFIEEHTRDLDDFRVKMTSNISGQSFDLLFVK